MQNFSQLVFNQQDNSDIMLKIDWIPSSNQITRVLVVQVYLTEVQTETRESSLSKNDNQGCEQLYRHLR
jgi:hypothetical protein